MRSLLWTGPILALIALAACAPEPMPPGPPPAPAPPPSAVAAPTAPAPAGPPAAPIHEARDDYFGTTIVDPYRWMESDSPELTQWMKAQADYTRGAIDALPFAAALRARVKELDNAAARVETPVRRGKALFYLAALPGTNSYKLFTREGFAGKERVLVDPDALLAGDKHFSIDYFKPSPDGRLVAYGLSQSGSEASVIHVVETATTRVLPDAPYPAVLLTTGITDPRVSPWQSAKMAARLQAATSSGKPVLLRVDYEAGHGMGSSRSQSEDELADVFAFLLWQVGKR